MAFLPDLSPADTASAARAVGAVEAVVEAGAARLVAEPWRVGRIVLGAESLSCEALKTEVERRRALPAAADFNRRLALAQLARALERPAFIGAWRAWRH